MPYKDLQTRREYRKRHPDKAKAQAERARLRKAGIFVPRVPNDFTQNSEADKARNKRLREVRRNAREGRKAWRAAYVARKGRDYWLELEHRRRAKKHANGVERLPNGWRQTVYHSQNGRCKACQDPLGTKYDVDHVVAIVKGGAHRFDNLQFLCKPCNRNKWMSDNDAFMRVHGTDPPRPKRAGPQISLTF